MSSKDRANLPSVLFTDVMDSAGLVAVANTFSVDSQFSFLKKTDARLLVQLH